MLCLYDLVNLRLENASLTLFGGRVTPAVQRYHVEPDGQTDGQSLWLLQYLRRGLRDCSLRTHICTYLRKYVYIHKYYELYLYFYSIPV